MALALTAATKSCIGDRRAVADSEQAVAESRAHILSMMEDRYGTNWDKVQQTMNAAHGPEWTNQLAPDQWLALHDLRHRLAEHRD